MLLSELFNHVVKLTFDRALAGEPNAVSPAGVVWVERTSYIAVSWQETYRLLFIYSILKQA